MLTLSNPIKAGREQYYEQRAQEAYYTNSEEEKGQWFGKWASLLGLEGKVTTESFHNLFLGYSPDGSQPLVQNAGHPDRCMGWDLTFSAPKSVSVLWALSPEEIRVQISQAHQRAVAYTLAILEDTLAISRRGKAGAVHEKAGLVGVLQQHYASRENDVQIHSHAVVINVGVRADGSTGALHSINWFRAKLALGAEYQKRFAMELRQTLGLSIEWKKTTFHIQGVPEDTCDGFSKRRQTIKRVLRERGETGAIAAQKVTLQTRPKKKYVPLSELLVMWRSEAEARGWGVEQAAKLIHTAREQKVTNEQARAQSATDKLTSQDGRSEGRKLAPEETGGASKKVEETRNAESARAKEMVGATPDKQPKPNKEPAQAATEKAESQRTAEALAAADTQASARTQTGTRQSVGGKRQEASQRKPPEKAQSTGQSEPLALTEAESVQKEPATHRIELLGTSDAKGRKRQPEPLRYLFEGVSEKAEATAQKHSNYTGPRDVWMVRLTAPASVNVLWALSAPNVRQTIEQAHQAAAEYAIRHAESNMGAFRRSADGNVQQYTLERVSIAHRTLREQKPLLTTKAVLKPKSLPSDGSTASETRIDSFAGGIATRVLYEVQLAAELRQRLGLKIEPEQKGFGIARVPHNLCEGFAARCDEIAHHVRRENASNPQGSTETQKAETRQRNTAQPSWLRSIRPDRLSTVIRGSVGDERLSALWKAAAESFNWNPAQARKLVRRPRAPQRGVRAFRNAMAKTEEKILPEKQTGRVLSTVATRLAKQHGAGAEALLRTLRGIRPAAERSFIHVEWRRVFPKAPRWSPVKNLKLPRIALGERARRWDKILWRKRLLFIELRIQKRRLIPCAPAWTGLRKLELPALRIRHRWPQLLKRPEAEKHQMKHGH